MNWKIIFKAIGIGVLISCYITMVWTFLGAYATPEKEIVVAINDYQEAKTELVFMVLSFIPVVLTVVWYLRDTKRGFINETH